MNKYLEKLAAVPKVDKFDEALSKFKELAERAKKDPEFSKKLGQSMHRARTVGTSKEKAWD